MFKRNALVEEIIRKCGKTMVFSEIEEEEEMVEEDLHEESVEDEGIKEEEFPFEDILAEKRRKYGAKDEFVYFLYNDLLQYFVTEWDGHYLRKKFIPSKIREKTDENIQNQHEGEEELSENIGKDCFDKDDNLVKDKRNILCPKLILKDEYVHLSFVNGLISGQFEQNQIHGNGMLEWQSNSWYEGKFAKGYRHGKGTLLDKDYHRLYIGEWHMGYRHGKGYCRYAEGDSYDGEWLMGKKNGSGLYIYLNGAQYKGHWKNDLRHGNGIMAWPNGDVYYGEWKHGDMHGYGECIWHSYCNKSLSWPQNISYMGNWHYNTRHGRGLLKLNSMGGAKYFGNWKHNKKHGYGMIIGNNGEMIEGVQTNYQRF
ncbi:hypothetical protein KPH14_012058 [Odynerus spinipes]|uniref:MORN repeat protein n=1 Tax=Odynerus spinipes TaxID=1348599 RepID=A0AAD9R9G7_9HYME|nr:hypothetical protein KPH14_012058 [Odynerus spinipes]